MKILGRDEQPFARGELIVSKRKGLEPVTNNNDFGKILVVHDCYYAENCGSHWCVVIEGEQENKDEQGRPRMWDSGWFRKSLVEE